MKKNLLSLAIMFLMSIPAFCQSSAGKENAESVMEAYAIYILIGIGVSIGCTALGVYFATAYNLQKQHRLTVYQNRLLENLLKNQGGTDESIRSLREHVLKATDPV